MEKLFAFGCVETNPETHAVSTVENGPSRRKRRHPERPRVVLAEGRRLFADALCHMLEAEFDVVACVADGERLIEAAHRLRPELILLDMDLAGVDRLNGDRSVRDTFPSSRVILIADRQDIQSVTKSFQAGVAAYVLKRATKRELVTAMHRASALPIEAEAEDTTGTAIRRGRASNRLSPRRR